MTPIETHIRAGTGSEIPEPVAASASQVSDEQAAWSEFAEATAPVAFCQAWLKILARQIDAMSVGLVLLKTAEDGAYVPAAIWPEALIDVTYLTSAAQQALMERRGVEVYPADPASGGAGPSGLTQIALPIETDDQLHGVVVLAVALKHPGELQNVRRKLFWASAWLTQLFFREAQAENLARGRRSALAVDLILLALEKKDFQESAMALVNTLAVKLGLRRVSLGLAEKGEVRICAVSHTAHFRRSSEAIQVIEKAMEEAYDQRRNVRYPPQRAGIHARRTIVTSDHEQLAGLEDGGAVASFLLLDRGQAFGVLTLESSAGQPLGEHEWAMGEACAGLLAPVLLQKRELDRWVTGKFKTKLKKGLEALFGSTRTSYKFAAACALLVAAFLLLAEGEFRVTAKTVVEGLVQRAAVAPFEGYIGQAAVRAGDSVSAGQVLATLDDKDLRLEQVRWQSEREQTLRKYRDAQAKHERADASVLGAQLNQAEAQLALIEEKLHRSEIRSPFDGFVVSGDLSQMLGAPVEQGKVLFEITPLDAYRVILKVDERDITHVQVGQRGQLALSGLTAEKLPFTVKKITSVSTTEDGINYFRVEAKLDVPTALMRPGMEGVGKIEAGERGLWWIWTHRLTDWLRISLWTWLP
ncbi:efflux RND transporter periplasmic adaptor subunit [Methylococcus sp. EFPC2]|uniref:efflux RND transporter periplasmic adaptor subunit n=1 Tax=Methylococcus sp. EFPC2 TaxID=2812648 RepID=UPI0019675E25|nr:HlyD family efflux transporter periplasmic adaptor subunit [Methylococcus sp. EFPC2]QSA98386.1 HlyD family efflux transporter periplasmic adaptor subunit [Methylococcus sp. EFPC2]